MTDAISRRDVLSGTAAIAGLSLVGAYGAAKAQAAASAPFVDVHCHMFNTTDLPLSGFAMYSLLRKSAAGGSSFWGPSTINLLEKITGARGVLGFVDAIAKAASTSAEDELRGSTGLFKTDQERIEALLKWSRDVDVPRNVKRPYNIVVAAMRDKMQEPGGFQRLLRLMSPNDHAPGGEMDPVIKGYAQLVVEFAGLGHDNEAQVQVIRERARELAAKAFTSNDPVALQVQIFALSMRPRAEIVRDWDKRMLTQNDGAKLAFGPAGWDGGRRLRIYTPAMVDYDFWVQAPEVAQKNCTPKPDAPGDECPVVSTTPLKLQNAVWSKVSAQFAQSRSEPIVVHPLTAFDPLRYLVETRGRNLNSPPPGSALALVKEAIETQGFVGVKVYPPMGFLPTGNADLSSRLGEFKREAKRPWGNHARDALRIAGFRNDDEGTEIDLHGAALDAALDAFYRYCAAKNVPIMAHTSRSQGTFYDNAGWKAADLAADPLLWKPVLDKYPTLRLNMAHAGGPWCLGALARNDTHFDKAEQNLSRNCELDERAAVFSTLGGVRKPISAEFGFASWPIRALQLISATKNGQPAYPNLFADVGDWDQLGERMDDGKLWAHANQAAERFAMVIRGAGGNADFNPALIRRKIMYGSDWIVMARSKYAQEYFNVVMRTLVETGALARDSSDAAGMNAQAFAGGNALDFLGLSVAADAAIHAATPNVKLEDTPRGRLQQFYARNGAPVKWAMVKGALDLA